MSKLKYIFSALLCLILIFSLSGCGRVPLSKKISISDKDIVSALKMSDKSLYYSDTAKKKLKKISSSGILEMYLDEKTLAVCIRDTISGKIWRSLPETQTNSKTGNITADIILKGREYTLNSQRDSLSQGCSSYNIDKDTLTLSYSFRRILENGRKIDITIPIAFTLTDGTLRVSVNCKDITDRSDTAVYLKSIDILPCFGSHENGSEGDYILLPSASGVILDTFTQTEKAPEIILPVYGEDIAKTESHSSFVSIGAFGMKQGDNAFICLIDSGEEISSIKAQKSDKSSPLNPVGASFEITPTTNIDDTIYIRNKA